MRATTLAALDAEAQRDAFNRVYEGYLLPLRLTTSQVAQHFALNDIAHEHSPVWLDDAGAVVALAALGMRDQRGWVGGFGVAPAARGQGLGTLLIATVIETALKLGLRRVQLEVLVGNEIARRLYEQARFVHRRWLDTFERPATAPLLPASGADEVAEIDPLAALAWVDAHRVEPAAWQREPARLARYRTSRPWQSGHRPRHGRRRSMLARR
jgi:GNAT superfamily N-acetyltransferase